MVNRVALAMFLVLALPSGAWAQYNDAPQPPPGMGGGTEDELARRQMAPRIEPVITVVELRGPLPAVEFQDQFKLTEAQAGEYRAVLDSFTAVTKAERADAVHRVEQLNLAIVKRDSAAAEYYREQLKDLGKSLRGAQSRFDDRVKKLLTKDQQKAYKDYRKKQEEDARTPPSERQKRRPG